MLQLLQPPVAWRRVRLLFQTTLTYRGGNYENFADDMDQTNQTKDPDEVGQIKQTEEFERFKLPLDLSLTFREDPCKDSACSNGILPNSVSTTPLRYFF